MVRSAPAGLGFLRGKQWLEPLPLRVGELFSFHTSECTPPSRVCKHALDLLSQLAHEHGRAVVIVTHDHRTLAYADRIVYVEDGQIREQRMTSEATECGMGLRL